jgi:hypothetical protein
MVIAAAANAPGKLHVGMSSGIETEYLLVGVNVDPAGRSSRKRTSPAFFHNVRTIVGN